jgi:hypothetical protein
MKKSILLLGGVGIGVGLAYALRNHDNSRSNASQAEGNGDKTGDPEKASAQSTVDAEQGAQVLGVENFSPERSVQPAAASMKKLGDEAAGVMNQSQIEIDDRGTDQQTASQILKSLRDAAFDGSDEKLALALGRPTEEIEAWSNGSDIIDGDVVLKARALANARGVEIQEAE